MHNKEKRKKIRAITECSRTKVLFCVCGQGNRIVVDCKSGTQWRQNRKYVRHSGDKNYPLSTKSTELSKFKFGDNVDRNTVDKVERAGDSRLSTNRRVAGLSPVLATVDFVAGVVNRYLRNALLLLFEISSVVSFARSKTQTLKFKLQKVWSEIMAYLVNILKIAFNYQWCGVSKIQVSRYVSYMLRKYLVFSL